MLSASVHTCCQSMPVGSASGADVEIGTPKGWDVGILGTDGTHGVVQRVGSLVGVEASSAAPQVGVEGRGDIGRHRIVDLPEGPNDVPGPYELER